MPPDPPLSSEAARAARAAAMRINPNPEKEASRPADARMEEKSAGAFAEWHRTFVQAWIAGKTAKPTDPK